MREKMEIKSRIYDKRISSENFLIETTLGEYTDLVEGCLAKNPFQRKKITSSKTVYSLLREDIKKGCVIPPIVLALSYTGGGNADTRNDPDDMIVAMIKAKKENLLILDGLQRTHSFLDVLNDRGSLEDIDQIRALPLRIEIYIGINKIGILYRMLTLNTGQTPMSLRQQIEMLYMDQYDTGVDGVKFIREVDSEHATLINEYNFREIIEGFNSYLERNEQPLERSDILENIKSLEKLSHENNNTDLFTDYVKALNIFMEKVVDVLAGTSIDKIDTQAASLWGKDAKQCFKKTQVFTGFGAAVGKLRDHDLINDLSDISEYCKKLSISENISETHERSKEFLIEMNAAMDWISKNTKKIGNAQRLFFQFYFRELFNSDGDSFLNLRGSIEGALRKTKTQLF